MIGQKISTKKHCRGIEQLREAWPSRKKKDKTVSFLENGSGKILEQSSEAIKPNTKLVLVSREPLLYLEFNKPTKQTFMRSTNLINSAFLSLKIIVDTLTDFGNAKHQNVTS